MASVAKNNKMIQFKGNSHENHGCLYTNCTVTHMHSKYEDDYRKPHFVHAHVLLDKMTVRGEM